MSGPPIFGYVACRQCDAPVLREIAYKTDGYCADHFRERSNEIIDAVMVVHAGREKIVLRRQSKRKPGERAQRARARKRDRAKPDIAEQRKLATQCAENARRRLQRLFPELWEVILADERAKAGLNAFTIDRCLRGKPLMPELDILMDYYHLRDRTDGGATEDGSELQPEDGPVPVADTTQQSLSA